MEKTQSASTGSAITVLRVMRAMINAQYLNVEEIREERRVMIRRSKRLLVLGG